MLAMHKLHFTDGETEVQRGKVSCSRVHCRSSFQIQAWQTSEPRSLIAFKTLVQGSWETNLSRHPSENAAPRNKAPHLRSCLSTQKTTQLPWFSPSAPQTPLDHLKRTTAQRLLSLVSAQARLMQDFMSQRISSSVSDQLGICPLLARSPSIQPHVRSSP